MRLPTMVFYRFSLVLLLSSGNAINDNGFTRTLLRNTTIRGGGVKIGTGKSGINLGTGVRRGETAIKIGSATKPREYNPPPPPSLILPENLDNQTDINEPLEEYYVTPVYGYRPSSSSQQTNVLNIGLFVPHTQFGKRSYKKQYQIVMTGLQRSPRMNMFKKFNVKIHTEMQQMDPTPTCK